MYVSKLFSWFKSKGNHCAYVKMWPVYYYKQVIALIRLFKTLFLVYAVSLWTKVCKLRRVARSTSFRSKRGPFILCVVTSGLTFPRPLQRTTAGAVRYVTQPEHYRLWASIAMGKKITWRRERLIFFKQNEIFN